MTHFVASLSPFTIYLAAAFADLAFFALAALATRNFTRRLAAFHLDAARAFARLAAYFPGIGTGWHWRGRGASKKKRSDRQRHSVFHVVSSMGAGV